MPFTTVTQTGADAIKSIKQAYNVADVPESTVQLQEYLKTKLRYDRELAKTLRAHVEERERLDRARQRALVSLAAGQQHQVSPDTVSSGIDES
jgi:hypothetical protein